MKPKRIFIDGCSTETAEMTSTELALSAKQVETLRYALMMLETRFSNKDGDFYVFNLKREHARIDTYQPNKWVLLEKAAKRNLRIEVEVRETTVLITANPMVLATGQNTVGKAIPVVELLGLPLLTLEKWLGRVSEWRFTQKQRDDIETGNVKLKRLAVAAYSRQFPLVNLGTEEWDVARGILALFHGLLGFVDVNVFGAIESERKNSYVLDAFNSIGVRSTSYEGQLGMSGLRIVKTADGGNKQFTMTPYMKLEELAHRKEKPTQRSLELVDRRIRFDLLVEEIKLSKFGINTAVDLKEDTGLKLWNVMNTCLEELGVLYAVQQYGRKVLTPDEVLWCHESYLTASGKSNKSSSRDSSVYADWYNGTLNKIPRVEVVRRVHQVTGIDVRFSRGVLDNFRRVITDALMTAKARELQKQRYYAISLQDWEQVPKLSAALDKELKSNLKELTNTITKIKEIL